MWHGYGGMYHNVAMKQQHIQTVRYITAFLAVLFFVSFFCVYKYSDLRSSGYGKIDLAVFYVAGASISGTMDVQPTDMFLNKKDFRAGIKSIRSVDGGTRFLYLPQSALLFVPLSWFHIKYATMLWLLVIAFAFVAAYYLSLWGLVGEKSLFKLRYSLLLVLLAFSSPVQGLFSTGQVNSIVWLLLVGFFIAMAHKRHNIAGIALAIVVSLKVFPVLLGPYLLIRKEWKIIISAVVAFLLLFLGSLPFFSYEAYRFYFYHVFRSVVSGDFISLTGTSAFSNIVMWVKNGWFDWTELKRKKLINTVESIWQWVTGVFLVALYALWHRFKNKQRRSELLFDYSLLMIFFLFFAKAIHQQYHFWLIPFILYLLSKPFTKKYWLYHVIGFVSVVLTQFWKEVGLEHASFIVVKPATIGMLLLLVVAVLCKIGIPLYRTKKESHLTID